MNSLSGITNWPQAFVVVVAIIAAACVVISLFIVAGDSKFPWEK